jgi:uncharacterized 2Fe-2S/4Fe-4S cluster protein (DUF4445 family)
LAEKGLLIRSDCGGQGLCGKCLVQIEALEPNRLAPPDASERDSLGPQLLKAGYRLACRIDVESPLTVRLPQAASLHYPGRPPAPTRQKKTSFNATSPLPPPVQSGVAVDLGTTTIGLYLCDLEARQVVASAFLRNPQAIYGADVMSRIGAACIFKTRQKLQNMVIQAIETGTLSLCQALNLAPHKVVQMVIVGNPTMIHLLVGEDPTSIGRYPFEPAFVDPRQIAPGDLGFDVLGSTAVHTLPFASGFVGSDVIAAALATEMEKQPAGTLLVDIGTNGEILLAGTDGFWATSCATGPAFEGAMIHHGMEAVDGAIQGVKIDPHNHAVALAIVHSAASAPPKPAGLCGSGVVSTVAELLRANILLPDGRFNHEATSPHLKTATALGTAFELASPEKSFSGRSILLTQKDIRAIQLAKGALKAGIDLLCCQAGLDRPQQILMAGAFGNHIDPQDAIAIGMFPEVSGKGPTAIGNAAGDGAVLALLDPQFRRQAQQLARTIKVVDLVHHPDFEKTFIKALAFPWNQSKLKVR